MDSPYASPTAPVGELPQPPSAKSSKTFGILGICSHLLCLLGAPFAILFGILALVRHGRAKQEHAADPASYAPPTATGLVTGIVALVMLVTVLPMTGIVSAIAIPALLGQREKAKIRAVESLMNNIAGELARTADAQRARQPREELRAEGVALEVLNQPNFRYPVAKNPYGGELTPYRLAPGPLRSGEVALEPVQRFTDPVNGAENPAIVIRGQYRRGTENRVVSKVVALD
jgi:type II secretory pathway pseudopilin PulG